ncbi:hypothetical protein BDV95DRAFT_571268 [Massariosphaeria phaeospora]|uniref:Uncharacterized protein n=1 Tax=Massariosphaeria phaeospora TaxID=100035 RepID=A0A7C8M6K4_9PLEO|nr:hypothetical protein BDV95DRAFT_571268 [Massariosphaeria phaeospora]
MSAPNAGRQSPEPEQQTNAQQAEPVGANPNKQGAGPKQGNAQDASDDQKGALSSNPTHPLAKHAEDTTSKTK